MREKPLLFILLAMMAGIFSGMAALIPFIGMRTAIFLLLTLAALTLLLHRHAVVSSLCVLLCYFVFGLFLASESTDREYAPLVSLPIADDIEESLSAHREQMLQTYDRVGLRDDVRGIVSAMTLGGRQGVSRDLRQAYNITGAAHVFALSGLHIAIIFMFVSMLLPIRLFPVASGVIQLLLLWTFVFLVGVHPSILRAAVMFSCYCLCRMLSRTSHSSDVLILTATLLLIYNPQWLFDIGFQMSFMAMTGILTLCPRLMRLLPMPDRKLLRKKRYSIPWQLSNYVWGIIVVTIAATLGTAPLIAHYFGRLSCYGLLANLVVSPCAMLIIFLAILLQLSVFLLPHVGLLSCITTFLATILNIVVDFMNNSMRWMSSLPGASVEGIDITFAQVILIYIVIACTILIAYHLKHGIVRRTTKI